MTEYTGPRIGDTVETTGADGRSTIRGVVVELQARDRVPGALVDWDTDQREWVPLASLRVPR